MALQYNTIEYGWETNTSTVSGSTVYTFPSKSIFIPEMDSRTFISADVYMYVRDGVSGTTMRPTITTSSIGLWIDNNYATQSYSSKISGVSAIQTTADHFSLVFRMPFQPHFSSFFTGSNHILQPTFSTPTASATIPFTNHSAKIILTYQYDDSNSNVGIKTVRIPIGTYPTQLPNSNMVLISESASILTKDAYNVPILDTFLPESSKNYRDIFFEIFARDASSATTKASFSLQLSSGSVSKRCVSSSSLNSSVYIYDIYNVSGSINTATTHSLKAQASLGSRYMVSSMLNVTYEYDYTGSTSVMNSIVMPIVCSETNVVTIGALSELTIYTANLFIPENNPTASQSGIICTVHNNVTAQVALNASASGFAPTGITFFAGSVESGPNVGIIRVDLSPHVFKLNRGKNALNFKLYSGNNGTVAYSNSCYGIFNYVSNVMTFPGYHNKTVYFSSKSLGYYANTPMLISTNYQPSVDYSSFYINGLIESVICNGALPSNSVTACSYTNIYHESLNITSSLVNPILVVGDAELGVVSLHHPKNYYKKYAYDLTQYKADYSSSISIVNRGVVPHTTALHAISVADYLTFYNKTYPISCSLLNCNYSNVSYDIRFYTSESYGAFNAVDPNPINILYLSGSSVNKSGSFSWFDNFQNIYAVCYEPEFGISNMLPAGSGSHIIDFSTSSASPSEHSFTFIG